MRNQSVIRTPDIRARDKNLLFYVQRDKWLYLMILPVLVYYIIFKYLPMYGLVIAFKDYNVFKGIGASEWVGLENFAKVFSNAQFWKSIRNTVLLNLSTLVVNFPLTILVSLLLNEVRSQKFKKAAQSLLYLPHFISWVVVSGIAVNLFSHNNGSVNHMLNALGFESIQFLSKNGWWVFTYVICNVWKEIGWGTIIYLAQITSIDETLYEAAYIDGATKNAAHLLYINDTDDKIRSSCDADPFCQ